jgi:hypothetical protein
MIIRTFLVFLSQRQVDKNIAPKRRILVSAFENVKNIGMRIYMQKNDRDREGDIA